MSDGNVFDRAACNNAPYEWTHPRLTPPRPVPPEMAALCDSCPCWTDCNNRVRGMVARGEKVMGVWAGVPYGDDRAVRSRLKARNN